MKKAREDVEYTKEKSEWERARWMASAILQPHVNKKSLKPTDLVRFPWEKDDSAERIKMLKKVMKNDKRFPDKI